jgi:hypothetical protein
MEKEIVIIGTDLTAKKENVFKALKNDVDLINSINEFAIKLKNDNIEIFEQKDNILITEKGYYLAVYPENINPI